jgi:3D (Asp-Asp-Asp) domain-containing protein
MNPIFSKALIGLFALSGTTGSLVNASQVVQPQVIPTQVTPIASYTVSMTAYNAVPGQTKPDPSYTASGAPSNPEVVAARSRDLADELPFGTVIRIDAATTTSNCGYNAVSDQVGYRVIADTMAQRMTNKIDILLDQTNTVSHAGKSINPSRVLGLCQGVTISVVGHIDVNDIPQTQEQLAALVEGQPGQSQTGGQVAIK